MNETRTDPEQQQQPRPLQVRLPGFAADRAVGLGHAVSAVATALRLRPCGGCARRAAALNRWVVFTR